MDNLNGLIPFSFQEVGQQSPMTVILCFTGTKKTSLIDFIGRDNIRQFLHVFGKAISIAFPLS